MDRLEMLAAFAAAVDEGSLAAAGRKLGRSPAAMTRAIAALERSAGEPLFSRGARGLRPNTAGLRYDAGVRRILSALSDLDSLHQEQSAAIVISAPETAGRELLQPIVSDFLNARPDLSVRLLLTCKLVSLNDEEVDVALRIAALPDSELVARRLGAVRTIVCASPAYLERCGTPDTPSALREHALISAAQTAHERVWTFAQDGRERPLPIRARVSVTNFAAARDLALAGRGIARLLSYQAAEHVAAGRLHVLLAGFEPPPTPVSLVATRQRLGIERIRAFADFAAPALRRAFGARAAACRA